MALLRIGATTHEVVIVKQLLTKQGYWPKTLGYTPYFGQRLFDRLYDFQTEHQGKNGKMLGADGIVGDKTRWALQNATGKYQRAGLDGSKIPKGISKARRDMLVLALKHHGAKEVPNGANRGPRINKFFPTWALGTPWCCWFVTWCAKQVFGVHILGERPGACIRAHHLAKQKGMFVRKGSAMPCPGDAFLMLYTNSRGKFTGKGHIGLVYRVSKDGKRIQTIEGNVGNRCAVKDRLLSDPNIVGFIDFWKDGDEQHFELGLVRGASRSQESTR